MLDAGSRAYAAFASSPFARAVPFAPFLPPSVHELRTFAGIDRGPAPLTFADIEFPNDLLRELDRMEFYVYETHELIRAKQRPLVIITSNNEKELPDAFLRRCFFHYIKFPEPVTMQQIVEVHYPGIKKELLAAAMQSFFELRNVAGLKKKPSTSELLDWLKLLLAEDIPPEALRSSDQKQIIPPLHGALLKNEQDVSLFERLIFMNRNNR